jgi:hypothetical protein
MVGLIAFRADRLTAKGRTRLHRYPARPPGGVG